MQFFLQYYYSAILKLELYCSSILKIYIYILFTFSLEISLSSISLFQFSSLFSFSVLHLISPLFRPKHHSPPNINITHHNGSFFLVGYNPTGSVVGFFFFFLLWPVLKRLWVVVGSGVWVIGHGLGLVFGSWLGCGWSGL